MGRANGTHSPLVITLLLFHVLIFLHRDPLVAEVLDCVVLHHQLLFSALLLRECLITLGLELSTHLTCSTTARTLSEQLKLCFDGANVRPCEVYGYLDLSILRTCGSEIGVITKESHEPVSVLDIPIVGFLVL